MKLKGNVVQVGEDTERRDHIRIAVVIRKPLIPPEPSSHEFDVGYSEEQYMKLQEEWGIRCKKIMAELTAIRNLGLREVAIEIEDVK